MEDLVIAWVHEKNRLGLQVKDKYIQLKAQRLFSMLTSTNDPFAEELNSTANLEFTASKSWLARFKIRHHLVSRRPTSQRVIPENADNIAREFIQRCQTLISKHNIKPENILNMDQVLRYFEIEPRATITTKDSRQVMLRKGGTSHKRFTATFTISAAGTMFKPHLLFSNLKNIPSVIPGVLVEVNSKGMFSDHILMDCVKNTVMGRKETAFLREPTLYVIDAYGCHVNLKTSKVLERYNIFIEIVPERMTSLLKPLDVSINRSFQTFYSDKYDEYISQALEDPQLQTKAGNLKDSVPANMICTAFKLCGLVPVEDFNVDNCHGPLKALLAPSFAPEDWMEQFGELFSEVEGADQNGLTEADICSPDWFLPEGESHSSSFQCIARKQGGVEAVVEWMEYRQKLVEYMQGLEDLEDITDDEYYLQLLNGDIPAGSLETFAASKLWDWKIKLHSLDTHSTVEYDVDHGRQPSNEILLTNIDGYYCILLGSMENYNLNR